jgi:hypothetical protein
VLLAIQDLQWIQLLPAEAIFFPPENQEGTFMAPCLQGLQAVTLGVPPVMAAQAASSPQDVAGRRRIPPPFA